ncbi:MAG: metallophosphoesterase [Leptospiraceae bacterium]|nr:metallophosphoesterase [Leptospiraceae bacterium]
MMNPMSRLLIFLLVLSILLLSGSYYLGTRLSILGNFSKFGKIFYWVMVFGASLLIPALYFCYLFFTEFSGRSAFAFAAYTGFGFFTILLFFTVASDLGIFVSDKIFSTEIQSSRKEFFTRVFSLGASLLLTGYGILEVLKEVPVKKVTVKIPNLHPDLVGFRIVQMSDIHVGPTIHKDFTMMLRDKVNELQADMVAITGDLVDGLVNDLRDHVAPLGEIQSKHGTFFVTGNHEYYSGAISWVKEIKRIGIQVLVNENILLKNKDAMLLLAGVPDHKGGNFYPEHEPDYRKAIENKSESDLKILLAHQPKQVYGASDAGFDLQLSGHTHAGQYFPGTVLIHLAQKFVVGLKKYKNTILYVSPGTGYWGPPIRTFAPSEITLLVLDR